MVCSCEDKNVSVCCNLRQASAFDIHRSSLFTCAVNLLILSVVPKCVVGGCKGESPFDYAMTDEKKTNICRVGDYAASGW